MSSKNKKYSAFNEEEAKTAEKEFYLVILPDNIKK